MLWIWVILWMTGWFGEFDYEEPAIIKELSHEYAASARHIFADRNNSNGSQFQKTPTSTKIYTILSVTFKSTNSSLAKFQFVDILVTWQDQGRLILILWGKGSTSLIILKWASQHKKHGVFWSNVPDRGVIYLVVPGSLATSYRTWSKSDRWYYETNDWCILD